MKWRNRTPTLNLRKRVARINPMRADPSKTLTIRRAWEAELRRRFARLKVRVASLVLGEDAFGLKTGDGSLSEWMDDPATVNLLGNANPKGCNQFTGPGCSGAAGTGLPTYDASGESYTHLTKPEHVESIRRSGLKPSEGIYGTATYLAVGGSESSRTGDAYSSATLTVRLKPGTPAVHATGAGGFARVMEAYGIDPKSEDPAKELRDKGVKAVRVTRLGKDYLVVTDPGAIDQVTANLFGFGKKSAAGGQCGVGQTQKQTGCTPKDQGKGAGSASGEAYNPHAKYGLPRDPSQPSTHIHSPQFKAWFGDWEKDPANASKVVNPSTGEPQPTADTKGLSKVVDKEGRPVPVFHGTAHGEFHEFRKDKIAKPDELYFGPGFYFTEDVEAAKVFAEGGHSGASKTSSAKPTVMSYHLNIRKPFDADNDAISSTDIPERHRALLRQAVVSKAFNEGGRDEALDAGRAFDKGQRFKYSELNKTYGVSTSVLNETLTNLGHDGITVLSAKVGPLDNNRFWIAFEPTQVKSTNNKGTFDPGDPDVRNAERIPDDLLKALRRAGEYLSKNGLMPGYGQVYFLPDAPDTMESGKVWYVGGDGDEWLDGSREHHDLPKKVFKKIPGVHTVVYEAEAFPPEKREGWVRVYKPGQKLNTGVGNAFCPTGKGGGQDNSCSPNKGGGGLTVPVNLTAGAGVAQAVVESVRAEIEAAPGWVKEALTKNPLTRIHLTYSNMLHDPVAQTLLKGYRPSGTATALYDDETKSVVVGVRKFNSRDARNSFWHEIGHHLGYSEGGDDLARSLGYKAKSKAPGKDERFGSFFQKKVIAEMGYREWKWDDPTSNTRWKFQDEAGKVEQFQAWLTEQMKAENLLDFTDWEKYTNQAFAKGAGAAFDEVEKPRRRKRAAYSQGSASFQRIMDETKGAKDQFVQDLVARNPGAAERIRFVAARSYADLKGVTEATSLAVARVLAQGLAEGKAPAAIARDLTKAIDDVGLKRATTIARTETVRAHAEGQLAAMESMGVEGVGTKVEWNTAGDGRVCDRCRPYAGAVYSLKEARGKIPHHLNCRCAWTASVDPSLLGGVRKSRGRGKPTRNVFCATGEGGGIDPRCSPNQVTRTVSEADRTTIEAWGGERSKVGLDALESALEGGAEAEVLRVTRDKAGRLTGILAGGENPRLPKYLEVSYIASSGGGQGQSLMQEVFREASARGKGVYLNARGTSAAFHSKLGPTRVVGSEHYWSADRVKQLASQDRPASATSLTKPKGPQPGQAEALREQLKFARSTGERVRLRRELRELTGNSFDKWWTRNAECKVGQTQAQTGCQPREKGEGGELNDLSYLTSPAYSRLVKSQRPLSQSQTEVLGEYQSDSSEVNPALRAKSVGSGVAGKVAVIDSAMRPITEPITLYRGVNSLAEAAVVRERGYMSTSASPGAATEYGNEFLMEVRVRPGTGAVALRAAGSGQDEVLLQRGLQTKLLGEGRTKSGKRLVVIEVFPAPVRNSFEEWWTRNEVCTPGRTQKQTGCTPKESSSGDLPGTGSGDLSKAFGTDDPYVYHATTKGTPLKQFEDGLKPSTSGESGPGVYMANKPNLTFYHLSPGEERMMRVDKTALIKKFGLYPDKPDGIEFDPHTGEILLPGNKKIPGSMLEVQVSGRWKKLSEVHGVSVRNSFTEWWTRNEVCTPGRTQKQTGCTPREKPPGHPPASALPRSLPKGGVTIVSENVRPSYGDAAARVFDKVPDTEEMVRLTGAVGAVRVRAQGADDPDHGPTVRVNVDGDGYRTTHEFYRDRGGKLVARLDLMRVDDEGQGSGLGTQLFVNQVHANRSAGVDRIEMEAAGPQGGYVGYKVWPKLGLDGNLNLSQRETLRGVTAGEVDAATIQELYSRPGGRALWEAHGSTIPLTFDLNPKSRAGRILDEYVRRKEDARRAQPVRI